MKHIVVDLEMNNIRKKSEARRICTMETIEIGAVMLDDNLQEISKFGGLLYGYTILGYDRSI